MDQYYGGQLVKAYESQLVDLGGSLKVRAQFGPGLYRSTGRSSEAVDVNWLNSSKEGQLVKIYSYYPSLNLPRPVEAKWSNTVQSTGSDRVFKVN
jgi:hypothetical protein